MMSSNHKYTSIGLFDDTKKELDKIIFLESSKTGKKITYDKFFRKKLIKKVKKQKC